MSSRRDHAVESLEVRRLLAATPVLVGNINQQYDQVGPDTAVQAGNVAYFSGHPSAGDGRELFKTDGTYRGTTLVKDINPATGSEPEQLTNVGGTLFFVADDGTSGRELWKSDGTAAGTVRVSDVNPGTASSSPTNLVDVNGTLYFSATDGTSANPVLWKSDGTAAGTVRVTTSGGYTIDSPQDGVNYNGTLVVTGSNGAATYAVSNATATYLSVVPAYARFLTVFNNAVYFTVSRTTGGTDKGDLFKTDLTAAGTGRVKAIDRLTGSVDYAGTGKMTVSGDRLYFASVDNLNGNIDLYASDGTATGTVVVAANADLYLPDPGLVAFGTRSVIFSNRSTAAGTEPWVSDGTAGGARLLKDFNPGSADSVYGGAVALPNGKAVLLVSKGYGTTASLYSTDGTAANTVNYLAIPQVTGAAYFIGRVNNRALFTSVRYIGQGSLWSTDGTAGGTPRLGVVGLGDGSSLVQGQFETFVVGDTLYFTADNGYNGVEPFKSVNGAAPVSLGDLNPGGADSSPSNFVRTDDGAVYFTALNNPNGTRLIYRLAPGSTTPTAVVNMPGDSLSDLVAFGNRVYFTRYNSSLGRRQLWSYTYGNGATTTTVGGLYLSPTTLVNYGGALYFGAQPFMTNASITPVQRLYKLTADSTTPVVVADIPTGSNTAYPPQVLGGAGGNVYFSATTAAAGTELYATPVNGTGANLVADLSPGRASSDFNFGLPDSVVADNGVFYFTAYDATGTSRPYRTDGTAAGTGAIGGDVTSSGAWAVVAGRIYFVGSQNGTTGVFRASGTDAVRVTPQTTGDNAFSPTALQVAAGRVFVVGLGGANARWELWSADAGFTEFAKVTVLGTKASGFDENPLSSYYGVGRVALSHTDTNLFFPAFDPATGVELYRLSAASTGTVSGVVFNDADADGVRGAGEATVAGDTIYLDANANGVLDVGEASVAAAAGGYQFTGVAPGAYVVRRVATTDGRRQTSPYGSDASSTGYAVSVTAGGAVSGQDFGVTALPPVAVAADATVNEGGSVVLDGSASTEARGTIAKYEWDFNYDGVTFDVDATGATPTFSARNLDGPSVRTVALRVTDANGLASAVATATVRVLNVAPTTNFGTSFPAKVGLPEYVGFGSVSDPSAADTAAGFKYSFDFNNDGDFTDPGDVSNSSQSAAGYTYTTPGLYTVRGRVSDKDGGYTDYTTVVTVYTPAVTPAPVTVEAETGTFAGGTAKGSGNGGYTGAGYADFGGQNSSAAWTVSATAAGSATLSFRYANGGTTDRPLAIYVNNTLVGTLAFAPTGSWTTWGSVSIPVGLAAGTNAIKAVATAAAGGANVDSLTLTFATVAPAWLSASAGADYTFGGDNTLTVRSGVITLLGDAATTNPNLRLDVLGGQVISRTTQHLGTLNVIYSGAFTMAAGNALLRVNALSVNGAGVLDLGDSDLLLDYDGASKLESVKSLVRSARNNGTWTGPGLTTSRARDASGRTLAVTDAAGYAPLGTTFHGETLDASVVIVRSTLTGDANFDGAVNFSDFLLLQANYEQTGGVTRGDFNDDGVVNFSDFLLMQSNYGNTVTLATPSASAAKKK